MVLRKFTFQCLRHGGNIVREAVHDQGVAEDFCQATEYISHFFTKVLVRFQHQCDTDICELPFRAVVVLLARKIIYNNLIVNWGCRVVL